MGGGGLDECLFFLAVQLGLDGGDHSIKLSRTDSLLALAQQICTYDPINSKSEWWTVIGNVDCHFKH